LRSVADAFSIALGLLSFAIWLTAVYYEYRFFRLWRQEADASQSFTVLTPFLYSGSAECNALGRRANLMIFVALCAVGIIFMITMHSIGVYPAKLPN
jgi:hypothetical protein